MLIRPGSDQPLSLLSKLTCFFLIARISLSLRMSLRMYTFIKRTGSIQLFTWRWWCSFSARPAPPLRYWYRYGTERSLPGGRTCHQPVLCRWIGVPPEHQIIIDLPITWVCWCWHSPMPSCPWSPDLHHCQSSAPTGQSCGRPSVLAVWSQGWRARVEPPVWVPSLWHGQHLPLPFIPNTEGSDLHN